MMEEYSMTKKPQVPAFGYWDYCDELPVTHYFESAVQAGLLRGHYFGEDDHNLFNVSAAHLKPAHHHHHHHQRKTKQKVEGDNKRCAKEQQQRKQVKTSVSDAARVPAKSRRPRAPKAVDEDLYKIPPDLLYQKPKRKRLLRSLWSGCMGLNGVD